MSPEKSPPGAPILVFAIFLACVPGCRVGGPEAPADVAEAGDGPSASCAVACHGDQTTAAPPRGLAGETETTSPAVGAHRSHLAGSGWHRTVVCSDCHVVPAGLADPGHVDLARPADLAWGDVATAREATPAFDGTTATCSGTHCHGATLDGGSVDAPRWTLVDGTQAACGACHGLPPGGVHPVLPDPTAEPATQCAACHGDVIDDEGSFTDPSRHVDGTVDVSNLRCDSCHGSGGNPAPPRDTHGNIDTSARGVGAHRSHLDPGADWHADVECAECHVVPSEVGDAGHIDGVSPADLAFGPRATHDGTTTTDWNGAACAGIYCHGATLDGGSNTAPTWTVVDGTEVACGACHGLPPGGDHPAVTPESCHLCHDEVVRSDRSFVDPTLHIDGEVEVRSFECDSCHGSGGNPAPPLDTAGNEATTFLGVGAHRSHMATGSAWHADVSCTECHRVPGDVLAEGHLDTAVPAELTWGALATADSAVPSMVGATCSDVYCHGGRLDGGSNTAPTWTNVGAGEAGCGSCHGLPPGGTHLVVTNCSSCHRHVRSDFTFSNPGKHINGSVDFI